MGAFRKKKERRNEMLLKFITISSLFNIAVKLKLRFFQSQPVMHGL